MVKLPSAAPTSAWCLAPPIRRGRGATTAALHPLRRNHGPTIPPYPRTGMPGAERGQEGAGRGRSDPSGIRMVQPFPHMLRPVRQARCAAPIRRERSVRPLWHKDGSTITSYPRTGTGKRESRSSQSLSDRQGGRIHDRARGRTRRSLVRTPGPNSFELQ